MLLAYTEAMDSKGKPGSLEHDLEQVDAELPEQTPEEVLNSAKPFQDFKKRRRLSRVIIAVILLLVVAAAAFWLLKSKPDAEQTQTQQPPSATEETTHQTISSETKNYHSPKFFLSFDYPSDWKVVEAVDGSRLTIKSPTLSLPTKSGNQSGQVVMLMRDETQKLPEFDKGNAMAVRDSEKITYDKPSSTQRGQTYISFLTYASNPAAGLDGIFITGDNGYKTEQAIPKADIIPIEPIISVSFISCDGGCGTTALQVSPSLWDTAIGEAIKNLLKSLKIQ